MPIDIKEIDNLLKKYGNDADHESFLDIIKRGNDENIISLFLAHTIGNNPFLLEQLIKVAYGLDIKIEEIIDINTETQIDDEKRIDILIEGHLVNNHALFLCVIENKTWSGVHDNQCLNYYQWCEKYYPHHQRFYLLLKPQNNYTDDPSGNFKKVTYNNVYDAISDIDDMYVNDFKRTIENNLLEKPMNELDKYFLEHYAEINEITKGISKKVDNFFEHELPSSLEGYKFEKAITSYRFYHDNWWSGYLEDKKKQYYFYQEVHFIGRNFNQIEIKTTVKRYTKDSVVDKFIKENNVATINKVNQGEQREAWYIFDLHKFKSKHAPLSKEWKNDLINKVKEIFSKNDSLPDEYIKLIKKIII